MGLGYLIDIDGVIKLGDRPIPSAVAFLSKLREADIPFLLVTNNSTRTQEVICKDMEGLGIRLNPSDVVTSSLVAADFISQSSDIERVLVVGEQGLIEILSNKGIEMVQDSPDCVVVGLDRSFDYEKLKKASLAIRAGALYIATNTDTTLPTPEGLAPGAGAIVASISVSSGKEPIVMGKPHSLIFERSLSLLGMDPEEVIMIGDRYDNDVAGAMNAGLRSIMVETGVHRKKDIPEKGPFPDLVVGTLEELDPEAPL